MKGGKGQEDAGPSVAQVIDGVTNKGESAAKSPKTKDVSKVSATTLKSVFAGTSLQVKNLCFHCGEQGFNIWSRN